jgi:hypothetical protein
MGATFRARAEGRDRAISGQKAGDPRWRRPENMTYMFVEYE